MIIKKFENTIRFENDGSLEFFFVGSGSAFSKKYFQTNILIIKGKEHILVDCGTLCPYAFYTYNAKITDVRNFFITHSHADHIGGLEEVGLLGRYDSNKKPAVIIGDTYKTILWNQSLKGGMAYCELSDSQCLTFDDYFTQIKPKYISNSPVSISAVKIGDIDIKIYRTKHISTRIGTSKRAFYSYGILVDEHVLYPSDTRFDSELIYAMTKKYPSIDTIFHDCQFSANGIHAFYDELKTLPTDIKQKIYLCHHGETPEEYTPSADGFAGFVKSGHYYCWAS